MKKTKFVFAGLFAVLFAALIVLLKTVDVAKIGPADTEIGLSCINSSVHDALGLHESLDKITDLILLAAIAVIGVFAVIGLVQLIKRKSFAKVDKEIYCLAGLYAAAAVLYVVFEKIIVNYRPVLEEGASFPEASFPSSHTMLICVVFGSAILVLGKYIRNRCLCRTLQIILGLLTVAAVAGRLAAGVHWFTDILGAVIISAALVCLFSGIAGKPSANE